MKHLLAAVLVWNSVFFVGGKKKGLARIFTLFYNPIWRFYETIRVETSIGCHRRNQTNVWAFWRFDGTKTPIMRVVNVADFEACALTGETTGPESI